VPTFVDVLVIKFFVALNIAATPPFISAAPLPKIAPSTILPSKGGLNHASPVAGTTSIWPEKAMLGPSLNLILAIKFVTPFIVNFS